LKEHHENFMEETKLRQLWHGCDTNLVEAFNEGVSHEVPSKGQDVLPNT
jgi:hypothetical protein